MSFSYTGNPASSSLDAARFLLGDTNQHSPILQDEEITYMIGAANSPRQLKAMLFRQAANYFNARPTKRTLGPQSEETKERASYYAAMATQYEKEQSYSGVPPLPDYQYDKVFEKHMMANDV